MTTILDRSFAYISRREQFYRGPKRWMAQHVLTSTREIFYALAPYSIVHQETGLEGRELKLLSKAPTAVFINRITLADAKIFNLRQLPKLFPFLEILKLPSWNSDMGTDELSFIAKLERLRVLSLSGTRKLCGGMQHLADSIYLQELDISRCDGLSDASLRHLNNIPNLRRLNISNNRKLTGNALARLDEVAPRIEELDIRGCAIGATADRTALENFVNLRKLFVDSGMGYHHHYHHNNNNQPAVGDGDFVFKAIGLMKDLQVLKYQGGRFNDVDMAKLDGCPHLQDVDFSHCGSFTGTGLSHLSPTVLVVKISGCQNLIDITALRRKDNMRVLELNSCTRIPEGNYDVVLPRLYNIERLVFSNASVGYYGGGWWGGQNQNAGDYSDSFLAAICQTSATLRDLHLPNNTSGFTEIGIRSLGAMRNLRKLHVSLPMSPAQLQQQQQGGGGGWGMQQQQQPQVPQQQQNNRPPWDMEALAEALSHMPLLDELFVATTGGNVTPRMLEQLAPAIVNSVTTLSINGNGITDRCLEKLHCLTNLRRLGCTLPHVPVHYNTYNGQVMLAGGTQMPQPPEGDKAVTADGLEALMNATGLSVFFTQSYNGETAVSAVDMIEQRRTAENDARRRQREAEDRANEDKRKRDEAIANQPDP